MWADIKVGTVVLMHHYDGGTDWGVVMEPYEESGWKVYLIGAYEGIWLAMHEEEFIQIMDFDELVAM